MNPSHPSHPSKPDGATHVGEFYGNITYYRHAVVNRVSQAIEATITDVFWYAHEGGRWIDVGAGFSSRRLEAL